ncbi:protein kinase domain-containing protein [Motilimonas sp. KMU-193]|uniref:protein kinase domain-containing protein n=1 Tax=Motilimonas sp. KMU-193 TaxID=3388668 RepID=UPI00396B38AA
MTEYSLHYLTGKQEPIHLNDKPISQGADGAIFICKGKQLAVKLYHDANKDETRQQKIWQMIKHSPQQDTKADFAWPIAVVANSKGSFLGYAMPLINMQQHTELENILTFKLRQHLKLSHQPSLRLKAAISLANRVASLHQAGHYIIDLKPINLTLNKETGAITVLDCDGFAISSRHQFFPAHQFTAGYIAPEAFSQNTGPDQLDLKQDLFALAVIIFQLINNGIHPFQGVPAQGVQLPTDNQARIAEGLFAYHLDKHPLINPSPWSVHHDFPDELTAAFAQSLISTDRLDAKQWEKLLTKHAMSYRICTENTEHEYWGNRCPWCQLNQARQAQIRIQSLKINRSKPRVHIKTSAIVTSTTNVNPAIQQGPYFPHVSWLTIILVNIMIFVLFISGATWIGEHLLKNG